MTMAPDTRIGPYEVTSEIHFMIGIFDDGM